MRKVLAEMRAARFVARQRRRADRFAHGDEALEVQPVVPGQIVAKVGARDAGFVQIGTQLAQPALRAPQSLRVAQDADVVPHHLVERLADRLDVARGLRGRLARARLGLVECAAGGLAPSPSHTVQSAIASPAIAPNTVELATPLPPRRFAPCTPPVSSPAANSPSSAVRPSAANSTPPIM